MYDHQTESLWSHVTGEAIKGVMKGTFLETYPVTQTNWKSWLEMHPDTKTLAKPKLLQSHYASYNANPEKLGIFGRQLKRSQLPGKTKIIGLQLHEKSYAIPLAEFTENAADTVHIGNTSLLIYADESGKGIFAWIPRKDGHPVNVTVQSSTSFYLRTESGAKLNLITGKSESGDLELRRVQTTQAFWFGWHNFYPETEVINMQTR